MPVYEFKSPEGVSYYGEGASPQEAFRTAEERDPSEIAAMRTRQSVIHGAPPANVEIPEAARAVQRGEYGPLREAAFESATTLAGQVAPLASALGSALAPTATAESMFAAEPDAAKRHALEKQYRDATPKGQREILRLFNEQQGKIGEEKRAEARDIEQRGMTKKQREDWFAENSDSILSLRPEWQQQIKAAGSLPEAQEMFSRGMEERKKAGMTFAERYPSAVTGLEVAGMGLAGALPYKTAAKRLTALKETSEDAEQAFKAAWGAGARKSKGRESEAGLAENIMKETQKMWPISAPKAVGELTIPWIFGQAPNFLDITLGRLGGDPGDQEKVERAWNNILSLGPLEQALLEGAAAVSLGTVMGMGGRDWRTTKARGQGVVSTFEERRAAEAAAAKKRADALAAKAAAKRSPTVVPAAGPVQPVIPNINPFKISDVMAPGAGDVLS